MRITRPVETLAASALVALLTFPVVDGTPGGALDPSWAWALNQAVKQHLRFGPDIAFTMGPLGFVDSPTLVQGRTYALALLFVALVHGGLAWLAYSRVRRVAPWPVALLAAYAVVNLRAHPADRFVVLFLAWMLLAVSGQVSEAHARWIPMIAGALSGFALLVKFNTGVACLAMTGTYALIVVRQQRDWRPPALAGGTFLATFLGGWLVTGQRLGDIVLWARRAFSVANGYTEAMTTFDDQHHAVAASVVLVLLAIALVTFAVEPGHRVAYALVTAPVGWLFFKHSVVRFHRGELFLAVVVLVLVLPLRRGSRRWLAVAAAVVPYAAMQYTAPVPVGYWLWPSDRVAGAVRQVPRLLSGARRAELVDTSAGKIQVKYRLTDPLLKVLAGHTVHVDPVNTSAVLAVGATWRPVPVFQTYSAYTPLLDDANAATLAGDHAPEYVLRRRITKSSVDGRYPMWESPAYVLALACHYRESARTPYWQVLEHIPDRCGAPTLVQTARATPGVPVAVPEAPAGTMLYATIEVRQPFADRLAQTLARPLHEARVELGSAGDFRLILATASQPSLLRPPDGEAWFPGTAQPSPESIRLSTWLGAYTVRFYAVPFK